MSHLTLIERLAAFFFAVVWPVFSGLFNVIVRWHTDEGWVAFCERRPWGAMLVKFIRTAGLDPVGVVRAIRQFMETRQRQRTTVRPPMASTMPSNWAEDIDRQLAEDIEEPAKGVENGKEGKSP